MPGNSDFDLGAGVAAALNPEILPPISAPPLPKHYKYAGSKSLPEHHRSCPLPPIVDMTGDETRNEFYSSGRSTLTKSGKRRNDLSVKHRNLVDSLYVASGALNGSITKLKNSMDSFDWKIDQHQSRLQRTEDSVASNLSSLPSVSMTQKGAVTEIITAKKTLDEIFAPPGWKTDCWKKLVSTQDREPKEMITDLPTLMFRGRAVEPRSRQACQWLQSLYYPIRP